MPRDYAKEYRDYHGKPEQIKRRSSRNRSRRALEALGRVSKGDGKDVHHRNGQPTDRRLSNLQVTSKSWNRSKK